MAKSGVKTSKKSSSETPLRPGKNGGVLQTGNPGNKGGGRHADEFKAAMAELASSDERIGLLRLVLGNPDHQHWLSAQKYVTEYGYGKPGQTMTVEGNPDKPVGLVVKVVRE